MREILFRGKEVDSGEWSEGSLWIHLDKTYIMTTANVVGYEVIPETVGQFTGLKDDNGTRVYEGDIIERRSSRRNYRDAVVAEEWNCGCCSDVYGFATYKGVVRLGDNFVVIGNIHDNPELLKEGGKE